MSKRTDGGPGQPVRTPSGGAYGERKELDQLQQGAPLSSSPGGDAASGPPVDPTAGLIGLGEPSQMPDVPVTSGAAAGAGPGMEALGLPNQPDEDMRRLVQYLPVLEHMANVPGSSKAARNLVRAVKGQA
ncbi:hypothetical protein ACIO1C_29700 [Streptomyces sp. NPDC087420]|uniref:hypothetical protein n=1 Tax=Streptomyces sp. NPDC087420 TaxID=3365785 RepID=UPI003833EC1F